MKIRIWCARLLIAIVVFFNLQCSLVFLISPGLYIAAFDIHEPAGIFLIQGLGLLFLMWNVPYIIALFDPLKYRISLLEAIVMQAIGVGGETMLLTTLPSNLVNLHESVLRFIYFDSGGLVLLIIAWLLTFRKKTTS